ncbi:MAG: hypothetical protein Kow00124_23790 [Anaerolineae bacterium]
MTETALTPEIEGADANRKKTFSRIVVWGLIGLMLVFLALGLMKAFESQPTQGFAPDFTLQLYNNEGEITLSDLRGQVVVINFWASWCAPCADEAPALEAAWQAYRDRGVMFLGVGYVDSEAAALEYMAKYGVTYPNGPDLRTQISDLYNIRGVPETFVVDREGRVTFFAARPLTYNELAREIERALAGG